MYFSCYGSKNLFLSRDLFFGNVAALLKDQARVVQKLDNAIHRISHYPADSVIFFVNIYPLDSDLSGG